MIGKAVISSETKVATSLKCSICSVTRDLLSPKANISMWYAIQFTKKKASTNKRATGGNWSSGFFMSFFHGTLRILKWCNDVIYLLSLFPLAPN